MFYKPLLYPLLIQVALTFAVLAVMFVKRLAEFSKKRIDPQTTPTRSHVRAQLTDSASAADNFQNQFELPILFFVAVLLAITLLLRDPLLAALAWAFVTMRVLHALVHVTYNTVLHRFYLFACSAIALLALWVRLGWLIILQ